MLWGSCTISCTPAYSRMIPGNIYAPLGLNCRFFGSLLTFFFFFEKLKKKIKNIKICRILLILSLVGLNWYTYLKQNSCFFTLEKLFLPLVGLNWHYFCLWYNKKFGIMTWISFLFDISGVYNKKSWISFLPRQINEFVL